MNENRGNPVSVSINCAAPPMQPKNPCPASPESVTIRAMLPILANTTSAAPAPRAAAPKGGKGKTGPHAYLLLTPATQQKGWAAIDAIRAGLPAEERQRIRTAGLVSSQGSVMYVDFDGTCAASFVGAAQRIAEQAGTSGLSCKAKLPGAL